MAQTKKLQKQNDFATPLDEWMHKNGVDNSQMMLLLKCARGIEPRRNQISMWRSGFRNPGKLARYQIEQATGGGVKITAWPNRDSR